LSYLDIEIIEETPDGLKLKIPLYRVDVYREADVVEEILRIYGYNSIELREKVESTLSYVMKPDKEKINNIIADLLTHNGFTEIMVNSLTPANYYKERSDYPSDHSVMINNPLSSDLNAMRQSMIFGGLETISYNINRKSSDLRLYEFGNCYFFNRTQPKTEPLSRYREEEHLALYITGRKHEKTWNATEEYASFFYLKSFVEKILERLGFDGDSIKMEPSEAAIFSEGVNYIISGDILVSFGIVGKKLLNQFAIDQDVYYADFYWDKILRTLKSYKISFKDLPKYPEVKRDLALLLDKNIKYVQLRKIALETEKYILKSVNLFDVFEDEKIGKDKKSYALSFTLQDERRTLTDKQIDQVMDRLIKAYEEKLNAKIR
jgi:phenylalanyl-tRNA synthetase beta chain